MVVAKTDRAHRGAGRAVRRSRPHRAAAARLSGLRLGRARTGRRARSTSRSTAIRTPATRWRCARRGREAITHWEVLDRYSGTDGKPVASLLACRLETGRTHQIRVHLAHIGHPLLGDDVYGPGFQDQVHAPRRRGARSALAGPWTAGPACLSIGFRAPHRGGEYLEFRSEPPADLSRLHRSLGAAQRGPGSNARRLKQVNDLRSDDGVTVT